MPTTAPAITPTAIDYDADFDLDISVVESGPVVADLMRNTDDNCGHTCETACTSCTS